MKKFSLEEYLKNPDRKLVTRDGRSARIICTDRRNEDRDDTRIILALVMENGRELIYSYYPNGKHCASKEVQVDLFFEPTKKEGWVNTYKTTTLETICTPGCVFNTKEEALSHKSGVLEYVGTCKIEWEE